MAETFLKRTEIASPAPDAGPSFAPNVTRERVIVEHLELRAVSWTVREVGPSMLADGRIRGYLVFTSPMAMRRVYNFPADWHLLSDVDLLAVSWRR